MDVTKMSRGELEAALINQTRIAKHLKVAADHWKASYERESNVALEMGRLNLKMRALALQITEVSVNGQDC